MSFVNDWRLRSAVRRGDIDRLSELVARGADIESKDASGLTCLMIAANRGETRVIARLLSLGADANATSTVGGRWSGFTPLMAACCDSTASVEPVRQLLEAGADPRAVDNLDRIALDYAVLSNYEEIAELLRSRLETDASVE